MIGCLFENLAYPVVYCESDIVPALRDPFCRAVTLRDPALSFDPTKIAAAPAVELAERYWQDSSQPRGRLASGITGYERNLTVADITMEAQEAQILIDPETVRKFTERCNAYREIFSRVFSDYTGLQMPMRGYSLFTPVGGRGRSPELHIDNTVLSLHWSAALSRFRILNNDPGGTFWNALDRRKVAALTNEERQKNFDLLVAAADDPVLDLRDNDLGDMMITKGQRNRDLSLQEVRQSVCVHVSSKTITQNGQAAFLMTPKMP